MFWGGNASQWAKSKFIFNDVEYNCSEQFMMAGKAKVFNDPFTLGLIMSASNPKDQKRYGRQVKGFNLDIWMEHATDIVTIGNMMKFSQNEELFDWALDIKSQYMNMVEASPYDRIWGIGMGSKNPCAQDESLWEGKNLLGKSIDKAFYFIDGEMRNIVNQEYLDMYNTVLKIFK